MTDKVDVSLDCRNFASNGGGYTNVTAANGATYSYKYTGGTDGAGNVTVKKGKKTDIKVTIHADARFKVDDTGVSNDPKGDIKKSHSGVTATFNDDAKDVESDIYYSVTVKDTTANTTFVADPRIDNVED